MRTDVTRGFKLAPSSGTLLALLCAALAFSFASVASADKRALALEDYHRLQDVSEPAFAPHGDAILYTVTTDNLDSNSSVSDLWRVDWRGGAPFQLTHTPYRQ